MVRPGLSIFYYYRRECSIVSAPIAFSLNGAGCSVVELGRNKTENRLQ